MLEWPEEGSGACGVEAAGKAPFIGGREDGAGEVEAFKKGCNLVKHPAEDGGGENRPRKGVGLGWSWVWLEKEEEPAWWS